MVQNYISRRNFLKYTGAGLGSILTGSTFNACSRKEKMPNLVFVFADQWRAQDTGYMGNSDVKTPKIDQLARESINFSTAVSTCPVCSPFRASLLTGQYPLTHGVFHNDKPLSPDAITLGDVFLQAGYDTGYIGKWHVDGHGRDSFIPKERRQGFEFWKVMECTHDYNESFYYADGPEKLKWDGYDTIAQTDEAINYIKAHKDSKPFILFLSWGPPHAPYQTAPPQYKTLYRDNNKIRLRANVPAKYEKQARTDISGYYAHISALDNCIGAIQKAIRDSGLEENTIFVFTSDHGDMLYSHGMQKKQKPWDESIRVPFLLKFPQKLGKKGKNIDMPIGTPDIMPTLLGLCDLKIPVSVEGRDYSAVILAKEPVQEEAALIMLPVPFHQWNYHKGGKEFRGIRTRRYTYVEDLKGPWILYDNQVDMYQMTNLVNHLEYDRIKRQLQSQLTQKLKERDDQFLSGPEYMKLWGYKWDGQDAPDL